MNNINVNFLLISYILINIFAVNYSDIEEQERMMRVDQHTRKLKKLFDEYLDELDEMENSYPSYNEENEKENIKE